MCNKVWEPLWRHSRQMEKTSGKVTLGMTLIKLRGRVLLSGCWERDARQRYVQQETEGLGKKQQVMQGSVHHGRDLGLCCTVMGSHSSLSLDTSPPHTHCFLPKKHGWLLFFFFWHILTFLYLQMNKSTFLRSRVIKETESFSFFFFLVLSYHKAEKCIKISECLLNNRWTNLPPCWPPTHQRQIWAGLYSVASFLI